MLYTLLWIYVFFLQYISDKTGVFGCQLCTGEKKDSQHRSSFEKYRHKYE